MKTILALLLSAASCWAAQFANITTGELSDTLPSTITLSGGKVVTGAGLKECALIGWRQVQSTATAPVGYTATSWNVVDSGNGKNCTLTVKTSTNNATEAAKAAAAQAAFASNQIYQTTSLVKQYVDIICTNPATLKQLNDALLKVPK